MSATVSPSAISLGGNIDAPSLRTISMAKTIWERETSFLHVPSRAPSVSNTPHLAASHNEGQDLSSDGGSGRKADRSVFGLPMLSCCTRGYRAWSMVILGLDLTYSAFILPISIGLQVNDLELTWACILDLVAGVFFAAELLLGFHVGFVATSSGRKREILDGRHVALYYMRHGTFAQDLLSTLIWVAQIILLVVIHSGHSSVPQSVSAFQIVRIVRMVRFLSIMRSMFTLTISSGKSGILPGLRLTPAATHVTNILYAGLVLVNFFGCLWNFIAIKEGFENTWMNPVGQLVRQYSADGMSILTPDELAAIPGPRRWLTGFYFSIVTVATLGYGDITPSTAAETAVDCFMVAFGVLMFGIIMGSIAEQVANSSREARQAQIYREKMASVRAWIRGSNMPKALKAKIHSYYAKVWVKHAQVADATQLFYELPQQLRQEIAWELNGAIFDQLPFFTHVDETMRFIFCSFMAPLELGPGQELCLRGEVADRFWVLHEGEVHVLTGEYSILRTVQAPAVLGDSALLQHGDSKYCVRPHGYRSGTGCSLWEVHLRDLMPFLLAHPEVLDAMTCNARGRLTRESILSVAAMSEGGLGDLLVGEGSGGGGRAHSWPALAASMGVSVDAGPLSGSEGPSEGGWEGEPSPTASLDASLAASAGSQTPSRRLALSVVAEGATEGTEQGSMAVDAHTVVEFAAAGEPGQERTAAAVSSEAAAVAAATAGERAQWPFKGVVGDGRGGIEPRTHSFSAGPASIQLMADARAGAAMRCPWMEEATAVDDVEQLAASLELGDPSAPVTRGEVLQAIEDLRGDIASRLDDISQDMRRAIRTSNLQAALPMWCAPAAPGRRRLTGQPSLTDRRGTRTHSSATFSPAHSPGMKWSFSQFT